MVFCAFELNAIRSYSSSKFLSQDKSIKTRSISASVTDTSSGSILIYCTFAGANSFNNLCSRIFTLIPSLYKI